MKITRLLIVSALFCALSMACYYGYEFYNDKTEDKTYPVIEIESRELEVSIHDGQEALMQGVTAKDEKDGDVTDTLVVESISRFANGERTVTYAAFDKDNHVSKATRTIRYSDYEAPKFSCTEGYRFPLDSKSVIDTMNATDCLDGDLTKVVKASAGFYVSTYSVGTYAFQYQVANSAGDVEYLPVTVEIYDPGDANVIHIELDQYVVYTTVGRKINPSAYLTEDVAGIRIDDSEVDYDTPGTYEIVFSAKDGSRKGTNRMTVVVR